MIYGYARVSSTGQSTEIQIESLNTYGCDKLFTEKISGRKKDNREQFNLLMETTKEGDTIVVTKLDRMARNTRDALDIIESLREKGVALVILNMGGQVVDTSTPVGKMMITMLAAVAEFEADMIRERQMEGIQAAKERGAFRGRAPKYTPDSKELQQAIELVKKRNDTGMSMDMIAKACGMSRKTLYTKLKENGVEV
ncbi:recombinase family protein [Brevibacillus sp. HD3.3A]|uniref:recombinase family protein n=1 Tax=Brevibacillus sp. HD3.3A TaxID=2738979 RepID=UPI00156BB537|nr:recombinase family protein [Brevibacillus sp. HD3.3A]UED70681.1 recombinase family protein [Brevibacillus sp. HD3.3A]